MRWRHKAGRGCDCISGVLGVWDGWEDSLIDLYILLFFSSSLLLFYDTPLGVREAIRVRVGGARGR